MGHNHRYKFGLKKKKKKQVKSPSIWSRTPNSVRIRQSGRTGNRGVTIPYKNQKPQIKEGRTLDQCANHITPYIFYIKPWILTTSIQESIQNFRISIPFCLISPSSSSSLPLPLPLLLSFPLLPLSLRFGLSKIETNCP